MPRLANSGRKVSETQPCSQGWSRPAMQDPPCHGSMPWVHFQVQKSMDFSLCQWSSNAKTGWNSHFVNLGGWANYPLNHQKKCSNPWNTPKRRWIQIHLKNQEDLLILHLASKWKAECSPGHANTWPIPHVPVMPSYTSKWAAQPVWGLKTWPQNGNGSEIRIIAICQWKIPGS